MKNTPIEVDQFKDRLDSTKLENKILLASQWLCDQAIKRNDGPGETCCWDHVTWDTANVIISLVNVRICLGDDIPHDLKNQIDIQCFKGINWLLHSFSQWEHAIKFPVGDIDVSCILLALLHIDKLYKVTVLSPSSIETIFGRYLPGNWILMSCLDITDYLFHNAEFPSEKIDVACWWSDYFSSAEVIEALGEFLIYCSGKYLSNEEMILEKTDKIRESIRGYYYFLETSQGEGGMWEGIVDTIRSLSAYLKSARFLPERSGIRAYQPEIHIAFKAFRWITDHKQYFSDGSFQHTMFLTSFLTQTLMSAYEDWEETDKSVIEVLDDVVWSAPVRSTPERAERVAAQLELAKANKKLADQLDYMNKRNKAIALFIVIVITLFLIIGVSDYLELISATIDLDILDIKMNNLDRVLGVTAIFVTLAIWAIRSIWSTQNLKTDDLKKSPSK